MTTLFGRRVIGEQAYEEQKRMVEEGRIQFGPRVVGPPGHTHGKKVVGEAQAAEQAAASEVAGKPAKLDDLKQAELQAICDKLAIKYRPVGESNASLMRKIRAKYAEHGAVPPPTAGSVGPSSDEGKITAFDLANAPKGELADMLAEVSDASLLEEAFHIDDREWAMDAYAKRAEELQDGDPTQ